MVLVDPDDDTLCAHGHLGVASLTAWGVLHPNPWLPASGSKSLPDDLVAIGREVSVLCARGMGVCGTATVCTRGHVAV